MPKNDLSAFAKTKAPEPEILQPAKRTKRVTGEGKAPTTETRGRKAKPVGEKESALINLRITEAEKAKLTEKAGLVPLATFLKDYLRKSDIFE